MTPNIQRARGVCAVFLALALISCTTVSSVFNGVFPMLAKHARNNTQKNDASLKAHEDAAVFITHVSLARIELASAEDIAAAQPYLDMVQHSAPKKMRILLQEAVLVLEYKSKALHQVLAPIEVPAENADFPFLLEIMDRMSRTDDTLQDIRIEVVSVVHEPLDFSGASADAARQSLDHQQQRLLGTSRKPAMLDDAATQLQLARFFIAHEFRDAAYLAVGNAKRTLAAAEEKMPENAQAIRDLSAQLEEVESQLHQTMPFKF